MKNKIFWYKMSFSLVSKNNKKKKTNFVKQNLFTRIYYVICLWYLFSMFKDSRSIFLYRNFITFTTKTQMFLFMRQRRRTDYDGTKKKGVQKKCKRSFCRTNIRVYQIPNMKENTLNIKYFNVVILLLYGHCLCTCACVSVFFRLLLFSAKHTDWPKTEGAKGNLISMCIRRSN